MSDTAETRTRRQARIATLKAEIQPLMQEVWKLEREDADADNAVKVGRFYKYRNRFSSDESWWLYAHVFAAREGDLHCWRFEKRANGEIEIRFDDDTMSLDDSWQRIEPEEFVAAWDALRREMTDEADGMLTGPNPRSNHETAR